MNQKRLWTMCMAIGLLLIAASASLTVYNIRTETEAGSASEEILHELIALNTQTQTHELLPFQEKRETVVDIYGEGYIGVLEIPVLGLQLPVQGEWSYPKLKINPCRFCGTAATKDLVLLAHNYRTHFGTLKNLSAGDQVLFTDMDGRVHTYEVAFLETVRPTATESVVSGEWDLTMFTCTIGGKTRVVVHCAEI